MYLFRVFVETPLRFNLTYCITCYGNNNLSCYENNTERYAHNLLNPDQY